jgi:hypothetical protein
MSAIFVPTDRTGPFSEANQMDNYIVRIYRQGKDNHRKLVGLVEEVGVDSRRGFTNLDELWEILNRAKNSPPEKGTQGVEKKDRRG